MANEKISALTASTIPLVGTELVPLVQTTTKNVSVNNLTAGRTVSVAKLGANTTTPYSKVEAYTTISSPTLGEASGIGSMRITNGTSALSSEGGLEFKIAGDSNGYGSKIQSISSGGAQLIFAARQASATWTEQARFTIANDYQISYNIVQGTAGKGFNFTANTGLAGMSSQLLNWYEEGTWTPTVTAASGSITSYTLTGANYTRIGRQISVNVVLTITNAGTGAGSLNITLPYTNGAIAACGVGRENALTGFIIQSSLQASSATMALYNYANGTVIATNAVIRVSMVYFV